MSSERARRLARSALFPAVERAWAASASLAGRAMDGRLGTASWVPGGRVLVVAAHPDDETAGAGGAIALHRAAGDDVTVVVVTDGGSSRAGGLAREEMARRRRLEVERAASILGVARLVCLELPQGRWRDVDALRALRPFVAEADVVYAPSCVDYHPDHVAVSRVVADLVHAEQLVRVYELGVPLTPVLANCVADLGEAAEVKRRALAAFETQRGALAPVVRLARYRARLYGGREVEAFWQLRGGFYGRAMRAGDWRSGRTPFHGLRERPLTDPLAAFVGLRRRVELRRAAGAGAA